MAQIKFGTDGWREIIAGSFTFENVKFVTQAVADYVAGQNMAARGVVIGYDNRFLSDHFARAAAEVLAGNDIKVLLINRSAPTPVTAFAVRKLAAAGALMITASHNPPEYNGIKFIPEYAGPALPYITNEIEAALARVLQAGRFRELRFDKAVSQGRVEEIDPFADYLQHLGQVVNLEAIRRAGLKVIVDPIFGAGIGYLDQLLVKAGCEVRVIHGNRDPLFGGGLPEPSARELTELRDTVAREKAHLGLAMDGDADRFGVIDRDGTYIIPNQVLYLLYYHLLENRGLRGPAARSVATTHMLDRIAGAYEQTVDETPVGFKYIGESMMKKGSILGGEESGGLSIAGHIPEKDGILATALIAELVAVEGYSVGEIIKKVEARFGTLVSDRLDIKTTSEKKDRVLGLMETMKPAELGGRQVQEVLAVDGKKFLLADGSWVLVRASGTEPMFRIYAESENLNGVQEIQRAAAKILEL